MANVALVVAILVFVTLYSNREKKENYEHQVEHFVDTTIAMERVTENYLEGEQGICDNWAQYINNRDLTLEEAAAYVRATHALATTSAHLIDADTLKGYSTHGDQHYPDLYESHQRRTVSGLLQPDHGKGRGDRGEEAGLPAAHRSNLRPGRKVGFSSERI